jgi:hypothetical protein
MGIYELAHDLENISRDDKKEIADYTDEEILHEAKYVLGIYQENGTISNLALTGEMGVDEQKVAKSDVRKLKALIEKYGDKTAKRKANPVAKRTAQRKTAPNAVVRNPKSLKNKRVYEVYSQAPGQSINSYTKLATFYSATAAKQYANAYAKANKSHYVRVESHG